MHTPVKEQRTEVLATEQVEVESIDSSGAEAENTEDENTEDEMVVRRNKTANRFFLSGHPTVQQQQPQVREQPPSAPYNRKRPRHTKQPPRRPK